MMINQKQTAILLFSRSHEVEAQVKAFSSQTNAAGNSAIAKRLIEHSLSTAKATGLPVYTIYGAAQIGASFGEKLANAIESIYLFGYEKLIVIGNDCPQITTPNLLTVAKKLEDNSLVLGPAEDGGIYLLGINKSAYQREKFIQLSWEKQNLLEDFKAYSQDSTLSTEYLHSLRDIDNERDFRHFLNKAKSKIRQQLARLVQQKEGVIFTYSSLIAKGDFQSKQLARAP